MSDAVKISYEKIIEQMNEVAKVSDVELAHVIADDLLCECLNLFGCSELVMAFKRIKKWYS